jgi:zinc transport system ATP-binding protein
LNAEPIISLRDVTFSYDGPPVLECVNLSVPARDLLCVIGPNGGGKTTLLKLMLGLIAPDTGTVEVLGRPPEAARERIGYMPQAAQLDPKFPVNVMDVVLMGRLGRRVVLGPYRRADKAVAMQALDEVGLADMAKRGFALLSGGQRQRVLIARALACLPEILLLDESMAGLDPAVQDDLYALLQALNERLTIVIVSHDIGFVSVFFKTVACVNRTIHTHPKDELTEEDVAVMYGREVRLLRHAAHHGSQAET